jgi:hypothetical protein
MPKSKHLEHNIEAFEISIFSFLGSLIYLPSPQVLNLILEKPTTADTIPTSANVVVPNYAIEFLYYQEEGGMFVYSHNSIVRQINTGINGPMKYGELNDLMANHLDFKSATLPDIKELKRIMNSDTKLRYVLMRNSLTVWSSTINPNGNVQCLNFRTGEIIEKSPDSNNHFVPIVKVLRK